MRTITLIILHCSATREGQSFDFEQCRTDHISHRGFSDIGYHFYITRDGVVHNGRPLERIGAHCLHHNRYSVGVCYEGGLDREGRPRDTRTVPQKIALEALLRELKRMFPRALIVGHRDLDPRKDCPKKGFLCVPVTPSVVEGSHIILSHTLREMSRLRLT